MGDETSDDDDEDYDYFIRFAIPHQPILVKLGVFIASLGRWQQRRTNGSSLPRSSSLPKSTRTWYFSAEPAEKHQPAEKYEVAEK